MEQNQLGNIGAALKKIVEMQGAGIVNNSRRLNAMLFDLCPKAKRERKLVMDAIQEGLGAALIKAAKENDESKKAVIARWQERLIDDLFLNEAAADKVVSIAAASLWGKLPNNKNKTAIGANNTAKAIKPVATPIIKKFSRTNVRTKQSQPPFAQWRFPILSTVTAGGAFSLDDEMRAKYGTAINAKGEKGWTPLHYAAYNNLEADCEWLIACGAHLSQKNHTGGTPLHIAAENNSDKACEILLRRGANVNAKDYRGRTPLHIAAGKNAAAVCEFLIKHGAKTDIKNYYGKTPLEVAKRNKSANVVKILTAIQ